MVKHSVPSLGLLDELVAMSGSWAGMLWIEWRYFNSFNLKLLNLLSICKYEHLHSHINVQLLFCYFLLLSSFTLGRKSMGKEKEKKRV